MKKVKREKKKEGKQEEKCHQKRGIMPLNRIFLGSTIYFFLFLLQKYGTEFWIQSEPSDKQDKKLYNTAHSLIID